MRLPRVLASGRSSKFSLCLVLFLLIGVIGTARAQTSANAVIANTDLGGGVFQYTITLTNTGTTGIQTFWFAWVPGQDYLGTIPTNIVSPTGWTEILTGAGGGSDGTAIQWKTSTNTLAAGSQLTFSFQSTDTPAEIAGNSVFHSTVPVGTSFVYSGQPLSGTADEFVVMPAPVAPTPQSFVDWETAHNVTTGPTDTPLGDSTGNLLKYFCDIDPSQPMTAAERVGLPQVGTTEISGTQYITLTFKKSATAENTIVNVQQSTDLQTWSAAPAPVQLLVDPTTQDITMQAQIPITGGPQFVRLNLNAQ